MWHKISDNQIELKIFAKPNAKKTALVGVNDQGLNISLHAKPLDDAANIELISFLSDYFDIPKSQITLKRGGTSRHKWVSMPLNEKIKKFLISN
jgi:uncharacterized protein